MCFPLILIFQLETRNASPLILLLICSSKTPRWSQVAGFLHPATKNWASPQTNGIDELQACIPILNFEQDASGSI